MGSGAIAQRRPTVVGNLARLAGFAPEAGDSQASLGIDSEGTRKLL